MNNEIFCERCGAVIEDGESYDFNGETYCERCYQRDTVACSHCGDRILWEDNAGSEDLPLCSDCYDDYYTTCADCGRIIPQSSACYLDYDDDAYCERCFSERDNDAIHEYCYKPDPIFYGSGTRFFGVELEIDEGGKISSNAEKLLDVGNSDCEKIYIKSDGSLDDGMEIVSHPMTLDYHKTKMP